MAKNVYEGLFILDSNRYARDAGGVSGQIAAVVQKHGGEVLVSRLWEERRLAYPIAGQRKGTYWLAYFRLDSRSLVQMERDFRLNDSILRSLVLRVEPRLVEALVSHAVSGTIAPVARPARRTDEVKIEGAEVVGVEE